jgi:alkylation response protein AidB-like acyl-CoA dehydrogenase
VAEVASRRGSDGRPLGLDPLIRQKIADLYARSLVHHVIGQRVLTIAASDGPPGPVTSIGKLYFCPLVEDLADFRLSLDPLGGQFDPDDDTSETARWVRLAYQSRGTAIAGGSTFIQRNILAERMLGMPRN